MRNSYHFIRVLTGLGFTIASLFCSAQVVLNGGFEQVDDYPSLPGSIELAEHWISIGTSSNAPDLFHVMGSAAGDLPETPVAMVSPFQGLGIAGFSPYNLLNDVRRQYLCGAFSDALVPGQRYQMTWNMTNGEVTTFSNAGLGLSGLGVRFSHGPMQQADDALIDVAPHFEYSQVFYNREWQQISFNFVAHEAWSHFTLGLFGVDPGVVTVEHGENPTKVYCFVDAVSLVPSDDFSSDEGAPVRGPESKPDVSVVDLTSESTWFVPSAFTPNGDGDNDVFRPICENVLIQSFEVYSRWGQMIFSGSGEDVNWDGQNSDGSPVESGSYVWKLNVLDPQGQLVSKSGSLSLIR
jgi:gliding motility-associated-like protein